MEPFIAINGISYSEKELSNLDSMPNGSNFFVLNLKGSSVTRLPSGLNADQLNLTKSKLTSLGQNIQAKILYLDSTGMLSFPVACNSCVIKTDGASQPYFGSNTSKTGDLEDQLNLKNILTDELRIITSTGNYRISQAKAAKCLLSSFGGQIPGTYTIEDSEFETIKLEVSNGSTVILNNVKSNALTIRSDSKEFVLADLAIRNSAIDHVMMSGLLQDVQLLELTLYGSLQIKGSNPKFALHLPEVGLITGNLELPSALNLPPNLCCLGIITRT